MMLEPTPLIAIPIFKIIDAIDAVATMLLNPAHPLRQAAEVQLAQSSSKEMAQLVINDLFCQLTKPMLVQLLEEELGDPLMLDTFRPRRNTKGLVKAYGPRLITHILPGNIPGIAVMSFVFALLVKSHSIAKISSHGPSLVPHFLSALQQVDPTLSDAITLILSGENEKALINEAFNKANLVILYGSDETVRTVWAAIPPETKTIVYGPKVSLGMIAKEEVSPTLAQKAARDIALYDQRGCLSPHLYYVEDATEALRFAQWVAEALDKIPLSKGPTNPETASAIQQWRGAIPLKGGTVFASKEGVDWTVLYDPNPSFTISPCARTIFIKPIPDLAHVITYLKPMQSILSAVGLAAPSSRTPSLLDDLGRLGVSRICSIGKMQEPPLIWHHDGRFRILDLLRFVDLEP